MPQTDNLSSMLSEKYYEYCAKLIVCEPVAFDALYAQYKDEYMAAGGQTVYEEQAETYRTLYPGKYEFAYPAYGVK